MATVDIYNLEKEKVGEITLSDDVFGIEPNPKVFYEVIRAQLATARAGTHKTK
ncbi:MAG: 50S ribosomal protein L4, partial [Deltaproteobacteria bacterium]|nr:50S ribosomal protein L4 [Deltaproteobacteria bacterium]